MTPCTLWYLHDPFNDWQFNHLEDGHALTRTPTPKFPSQSGWRNGTWEKYHRALDDSTPPRVVAWEEPTDKDLI